MRRRRAEHGPNELRHEPGPSAVSMLVRQLASPLVGLLFAAAAVAAVLGDHVDAIAIGAIVVLNAVVGFVQEWRAESALAALRSLTAPRARVRRGGRAEVIAAVDVVPGDVLLLEAGDLVAADGRLVLAHDLATVEAALTGESLPVRKGAPAAPDAPLAERTDRVFLGTSIARGSGEAVVEATGMATEMGRIATLLSTAQRGPTPLQLRLAAVSRTLLWICLLVVGLVAALGLLRGLPPLEVVLSAVSLAVAAVPEGLPAVVTIALAVGVQRLAGRNVLIRRLPAVETLGEVSVICTDKTGTLTTGVMSVREAVGPDRRELLRVAAGCVDAEIGPNGGVGDPTEVAILEAAKAMGIHREDLERDLPRRNVVPFDAATKWMIVERSDGLAYVKGAAEVVLPRCVSGVDGVNALLDDLTDRGLRVLAVAIGRDLEALHLVGLLGLADPPRPEVVAAVAAARTAGIRVVMITGDHPRTAHAIARELGVTAPDEDPTDRVFARATPEDKLRLVRAWKERGAVVAMTGDGVNDAPAIREAHVGIAMGVSGTEVTREAAAVVLADDHFASLVEGVREGRAIYENIRKTLVYLLAGNAAELLVMFVAAAVGLPLPLLPLHLLWINLVTDGLPALALVMDPADPEGMRRPPRPADEPVLGSRQWRTIAFSGVFEGALTLGMFVLFLQDGVGVARHVAFCTLVFSELFRAFAARSDDRTVIEVGLLGNLRLVGVVAAMVVVQVSLQYLPLSARLLHLHPLGIGEIGLTLSVGALPLMALELRKLVVRAAQSSRKPTTP